MKLENLLSAEIFTREFFRFCFDESFSSASWFSKEKRVKETFRVFCFKLESMNVDIINYLE